MRPAAALWAVLILASLFSAQSIPNPQLVKSASVIIDENGTVAVVGASVQSLDINLSMPLTEPYQDMQVADQVRSDAQGNQYIKISVANPPNPFLYTRQVAVQTTARTTQALPSSYMVPAEYSALSEPTARTQSGDQGIAALALQLTANSTSPFERVARLAIYVNTHMAYNDQLVGQEKDALWVLQNRQGVCVEYSTLFAALARSIGIPVRYVNGYVYSDKYETWMGHAWAEAYIGEWVPVDTTWFEVGSLDALHIEAGKYREISSEPSLLATISDPTGQVLWETTGKNGAFANNIYMKTMQSSQPDSDYQFNVVEPELAPGASTIAYVAATGKDYQVVPLLLSGCTGGGSVSVIGGNQYLILEPGKKSTAVWELHADQDIPKNYVFTCPLTLNSPLFEIRRINVRVDPRLRDLGSLQASLEQTNVAPGQEDNVLLALGAQRQGKKYYVVTPGNIRSKQISSSSGSIPFNAAGLGWLPVYLAAEGGGYQKLQYQSGSNSSISIDSFSMPSTAVIGKPGRAVVKISSKEYPADIQVEFTFAGKPEKRAGRIIEPTLFDFEFVPPDVSAQQATLRLYGAAGLEDMENSVVNIVEKPEIAISKIGVIRVAGGLKETLSISRSGEPANAFLKINGEAYPASDGLQLRLQAGTYNAVLSWSDLAGNTYEKSAQLNITDPGLFEDLGSKAAISAQPPPCPLALSILASALGFAFARRRP